MSWFPLHLSIFSLDTDFQFDCSFITVLNFVPLPSEPPFWWEIQSFKLIFPIGEKKGFKLFSLIWLCCVLAWIYMSLFWFDHFLNLQVSIACNLGKFSVFVFFFWVLFHSLFFSLLFPGLQTWMWSLLRASQDPEALFNLFPVYFPSVVHTKFYCSILKFPDSFLCP